MPTLRKYQVRGVRWLQENPRAILADEMGVGKTPQLLRAAKGRTLVVAPRALHPTWQEERRIWASDLDMVVTTYHSLVDRSAKDRKGKLKGKLKEGWGRSWDTIIFDEAHHLKGRSTGHAKAGVALSLSSPRVWMATGTPVPNWGHEVFMLLKVMYPGDPRFRSYWRWVAQWFDIEVQWFRQQEVKQVGRLKEGKTWDEFATENGLMGMVLRRRQSDVLKDLPPLNRIALKVPLVGVQERAYKGMQKEFFAHVGDRFLLASSEGARYVNLHRLSSGVRFAENLAGFTGNASGKLDALTEIVANLEADEPMVIFTHFRHSAELIARWLEANRMGSAFVVHGGVKAADADAGIRMWKDGQHRFLVGTLAVMSEGLTLTSASKMVVFERGFVPAKVDQAEKRIHRMSQKEPCTVWHLITKGTVDEHVHDVLLTAKREDARGLLSATDIRRFLRA